MLISIYSSVFIAAPWFYHSWVSCMNNGSSVWASGSHSMALSAALWTYEKRSLECCEAFDKLFGVEAETLSHSSCCMPL